MLPFTVDKCYVERARTAAWPVFMRSGRCLSRLVRSERRSIFVSVLAGGADKVP